MRAIRLAVGLLVCAAFQAAAAPAPPARPADMAAAAGSAAPRVSPAPPSSAPRPGSAVVREFQPTAAAPRTTSAPPRRETETLSTAPAPAPAPAQSAAGLGSGPICGDARLRGAAMQAVRGEGGCGIARPVRVTAAAGVRMTRPVTLGCEAARALADWLETAAKPAARAAGADLIAITPAAGYACRRVNNRPAGALSEHAQGAAIDVSAFTFADGREATVLDGWRGRDAAFLRAAWRGACGPFTTVLGPEADRWHQDHFHFDVKPRREPWCR